MKTFTFYLFVFHRNLSLNLPKKIEITRAPNMHAKKTIVPDKYIFMPYFIT